MEIGEESEVGDGTSAQKKFDISLMFSDFFRNLYDAAFVLKIFFRILNSRVSLITSIMSTHDFEIAILNHRVGSWRFSSASEKHHTKEQHHLRGHHLLFDSGGDTFQSNSQEKFNKNDAARQDNFLWHHFIEKCRPLNQKRFERGDAALVWYCRLRLGSNAVASFSEC